MIFQVLQSVQIKKKYFKLLSAEFFYQASISIIHLGLL